MVSVQPPMEKYLPFLNDELSLCIAHFHNAWSKTVCYWDFFYIYIIWELVAIKQDILKGNSVFCCIKA